MTAAIAYHPTGIVDQLQGIPVVDPRTGLPTPFLTQLLQDLINRNQAGNRIIPCNASGTNVITLTPFSVSPLIDGYKDYDVFCFVAAATSTGAVTATVAPKKGTLATIKVYKTAGAAQAGAGDVVLNSLYLAVFNDALDSGAGGLVLK